MITILQKTFYIVYKFFYKAQGEDSAFLSMATLSFFLYLNLLSIASILQVLNLIPKFDMTKSIAIISGIVMFTVGYFVILRNKKYLKLEGKIISKKYSHNNLLINCIIYLSASFLFFVLTSILRVYA